MIEWVIGNPDFKGTIVSVFLGHTLYFLNSVYPKLRFSVGKRDLFETPRFLIEYLTPLFGRNFENEIVDDD